MRPGRGRAQRQLRIIAGRWRGRKWRFPEGALRPTPDRVRETLFNWLQQAIPEARCLDLYAGSGALGLEALSRGARSVVFVEQQRSAALALEQLLRSWQEGAATAPSGTGSVICGQALEFLGQRSVGKRPAAFDVVFLDPPFASGELARAAAALDQGDWLAADARIYIEHARGAPLAGLPGGWRELRAGSAGVVGYHLFAAAAGSAAAERPAGGAQP
jgi:16S rRNA (guanine966-N2)-methyltransferase